MGRHYVREAERDPDGEYVERPLEPYEDIGTGVCPECLDERRLYKLLTKVAPAKCAECTKRWS